MSGKARVTLYTKPGCHLCEEAKKIMRAAACAEDYTLEEINIATDPVLTERYGTEIPVIFINGAEAFRHRVNAADFRQCVRQSHDRPR